MLTREADNRRLSPDPDPRRKATTNDDVVCRCVWVCMCAHVYSTYMLRTFSLILWRFWPWTMVDSNKHLSVSSGLIPPVPDALQSEQWPVTGLSSEDAEGDTPKRGREPRLQEGGRHPKDISQGYMLTYLRPLKSCSPRFQQGLEIWFPNGKQGLF